MRANSAQERLSRHPTRSGRPPGRPRRVTPEKEARILELRPQGLNWREIAGRVGLPAEGVRLGLVGATEAGRSGRDDWPGVGARNVRRDTRTLGTSGTELVEAAHRGQRPRATGPAARIRHLVSLEAHDKECGRR
jgi:hypothetical protein